MGELGEAVRQDERHAQFLVQNARILGFVHGRPSDWHLTRTGAAFLDVDDDRRGLILAEAVLNSRVVSSIVHHVGSVSKAASLTQAQIFEFLVENVVVPSRSSAPMETITADRRASSVRGWIRWLSKNLPRIEPEAEEMG